jgi:Ca-activated chloride channel family protein
MTFATPQFLWLLLLVPLTAVVIMAADRRARKAIHKLGDRDLIQRLSATVNWRGRKWHTALWLLAGSLLILALARPQWGHETQLVEQEGVQVMVALDISNSMLAEDPAPNRLERAKLEISDLMTRLGGDEVGLVLFSGASFVQFPLTSDYDTARAFLRNANPDMISRQGTEIGEAIRTALGGFDEKRTSQKVILIMTDGETHDDDVLAATELAAEENVVIYTVGFGSPEGSPVPELDSYGRVVGYKSDQSGNTVISRLDETTLRQIADLTGGNYYAATGRGQELDALAAEIDSLQGESLQSRFQTQKTERFQWFVLAGLVLIISSLFIPDRTRPPADLVTNATPATQS